MQEIQRVVVLGAGAMGGFFASRFFDAPELTAALLAREPRFERLRQEGLIVNDRPYPLPVIHPDQAGPPADLVIVALKQYQLAEAIPDLRNVVGDQTTIISVMNGLDSEEMLGAAYGMERLLYTISAGIDALRQGSRISYTRPGLHYFGEARNPQVSPKVRRVQVAFERAGIPYETPDDMMRMLWWKFMVNVGMNQASAVMRAPYGLIQRSPLVQELMESLMREVIALAQVLKVDLVAGDIEDWYRFLHTLSPEGKTSMLQDLEAGRKTEVEAFAGKVVALGREHGVPTPVNQTVLRIIQVLEAHPA